VRQRGGNDQVNGGGDLRGIEAGRVRERRGCRAVRAGLRKPVAGQTAPILVLGANLQGDPISEVLAGNALTPALTKHPVLVGATRRKRQNEIGQHRQDSQPGLPRAVLFADAHFLAN
jgi:hypothetical protein